MVKSNAETLIGDTEKGRESISEYGKLKEGRERERERRKILDKWCNLRCRLMLFFYLTLFFFPTQNVNQDYAHTFAI